MNANYMEKTIEIPFGAHDSELKGWEYTIPENMEAEIKDGKIIVKQKESKDERIRNLIYCIVRDRSDVGKLLEANGCPVEKALSWIEEQKEPKLESCDCSRDEESYTNGIHHVLMNPEAYGLIKQKPASGNSEKPNNHAEWSEEDDAILKEIVSFFRDGTVKLQHDLDLYAGFLEKKLKSLCPSWKPSEDEERLINTSISFLKDFADKGYENECIDWLKSKLNGDACK